MGGRKWGKVRNVKKRKNEKNVVKIEKKNVEKSENLEHKKIQREIDEKNGRINKSTVTRASLGKKKNTGKMAKMGKYGENKCLRRKNSDKRTKMLVFREKKYGRNGNGRKCRKTIEKVQTVHF